MENSCTIFWSTFNKEMLDASYEEQLAGFPESVQKRLGKYPRRQDKYLSLLGKLLLRKGLESYGLNGTTVFEKLQYTDKGRPYFKGESIDFSISHSGDLVVCALGNDQRLGIDVQKIVPISQTQAQFFVNLSDLGGLDLEQDGVSLINVWTKKEAVSKVIGDGLSIAFRSMLQSQGRYTINEQQVWTYPCALAEGYSCSLASNGPLSQVGIRFISGPELLVKRTIQMS